MATITGGGVTYKFYVLYGATKDRAAQYYQDPEGNTYIGPGLIVHTINADGTSYRIAYPDESGENIPNLIEWMLKLIDIAAIASDEAMQFEIDYRGHHSNVIDPRPEFHKSYHGICLGDDSAADHIIDVWKTCKCKDPKCESQDYRLPLIGKHSPTGFNWGYSGSGPHETAQCILADFLGYDPEKQSGDIFLLPMKFKNSFVSRIPSTQSFTLTDIDLRARIEEICPEALALAIDIIEGD